MGCSGGVVGVAEANGEALEETHWRTCVTQTLGREDARAGLVSSGLDLALDDGCNVP